MAIRGGSFEQLYSSSAGRTSRRLMEPIPDQDADSVTDVPAQADPSEPRPSSSAMPLKQGESRYFEVKTSKDGYATFWTTGEGSATSTTTTRSLLCSRIWSASSGEDNKKAQALALVRHSIA